ncbi:MAG: PD-(D/E)XK nuclease family protein, partial [Clostridia bacterium]|nr:PD-(D/E)XK nuclease family protein [Clostridia bacterium]
SGWDHKIADIFENNISNIKNVYWCNIKKPDENAPLVKIFRRYNIQIKFINYNFDKTLQIMAAEFFKERTLFHADSIFIWALIKPKIQKLQAEYLDNLEKVSKGLLLIPRTKTPLFDDFILDDSKNFCVLSGNSGVGKSHLILELCKKFGGYTIFSTEQELWKKINDNYALYGRLDTVLSDENRIEGKMIPTAILDFKATKTKSANECKANEETGEIADFQMAEFVDLIQEKFDAQTFNITQASFASISKAEFSDIIVKEKAPRTSAVYIDEFQDTLLQFRKYTDYFYEQIKNLKFEPIVSSNIFRKLDTYSDCITCDYKSICRTTFTVAGKSLSFEKN